MAAKHYQARIEKIKQEVGIFREETFENAPSGTHHQVFLSSTYVLRFRDDAPDRLRREAEFLKHIHHPLVPEVVWTGEIDGLPVMAEKRLPGKPLNLLWKSLPENRKVNVIEHIVQFIEYLRTQTALRTYTVSTGRTYRNFLDYLMENIKKKTDEVRRFKQATGILNKLMAEIRTTRVKRLFLKGDITLVHGDLIIHNLLSDGNTLSGVLDWELACYGDPDYDLFRLLYYQECAAAYRENGTDESFEADYMDKLIATLQKSGLVKNEGIFREEYQFMRALFRLNALYWAVNSNDPETGINELVVQWE